MRPQTLRRSLKIEDANRQLSRLGFPKIPNIKEEAGYYVLETFLDSIRLLPPEVVSDYCCWIGISFESIATITYDQVSGSLLFRSAVDANEKDPIRLLLAPYIVAQLTHPEMPIYADGAYLKSLERTAEEMLG